MTDCDTRKGMLISAANAFDKVFLFFFLKKNCTYV